MAQTCDNRVGGAAAGVCGFVDRTGDVDGRGLFLAVELRHCFSCFHGRTGVPKKQAAQVEAVAGCTFSIFTIFTIFTIFFLFSFISLIFPASLILPTLLFDPIFPIFLGSLQMCNTTAQTLAYFW